MADDTEKSVLIINKIAAIPTILDVVCKTTGMGFAAVAHVTEDRWIACQVRDDIQFGLKPGGELKVETTICHEIRQKPEAVIINHVSEDERYFNHHTPRMYGFQSYISMPIILTNGKFFGTLCAIDPTPHKLNTPEVVGMFKLFADLIAFHIDSFEKLESTESKLFAERQTAELREQFMAILSHDLRNPLGAIAAGAGILKKTISDGREVGIVNMIQDCVMRMSGLIENVLDFARGRLGGGITLHKDEEPLKPVLNQVIEELRTSWPDRVIETHFNLANPVSCDRKRIAQLFSNLLGNALTYGTAGHPIKVSAISNNGKFELAVTNIAKQIPEEKLQKLFQPYERGEGGKNQQGLGLGLYIVSEIAKAHDGEINVTSTKVETTFTLKMPIQSLQNQLAA